VEHGNVELLKKEIGIDADSIVLRILAEKKPGKKVKKAEMERENRNKILSKKLK
jgi:hypothetical protein